MCELYPTYLQIRLKIMRLFFNHSKENLFRYKHNTYILRGTRNLSFVLRRSLLRSFETIWILVITLECSNITASKSIRRQRKMRPMELSGVKFSTHCQSQSVHVLIKSYVSVCDELQNNNFV